MQPNMPQPQPPTAEPQNTVAATAGWNHPVQPVAPAAMPTQPLAQTANPPQFVQNENLPAQPINDGVMAVPAPLQPAGQVPFPPQSVAATPQPAPLNRDTLIEQFNLSLVRLWQQSAMLFDLPLDVIMEMVRRNAHHRAFPATGKVEVIAGVSQFTPTPETFAAWLKEYTAEVRRKEIEAGIGTGDPEF